MVWICRFLLEHLSGDWERLRHRVDGKLLQQTLMTFLRTNEEAGRSKGAEDRAAVSLVCEVGGGL